MNRLKELRKKEGLTLKEVSDKLKARDVKVLPDSLAKYERGDREPKLETWQKLADFFQVSVPYLQGFEQARDRNRTDYRYFIEADGSKYYGADELIFKNLGGQWFLAGYSTAGCRTLINTAKIVAIEEMYKDKDKQND